MTLTNNEIEVRAMYISPATAHDLVVQSWTLINNLTALRQGFYIVGDRAVDVETGHSSARLDLAKKKAMVRHGRRTAIYAQAIAYYVARVTQTIEF